MSDNVKPIKTYDYPYYCENCKQQVSLKLPFGELALSYNCVCPRCGISQQQVKDWIAKEYGQAGGLKVIKN